ncbi:M1 family aminopeptidase [Bacteroidota bacterium]
MSKTIIYSLVLFFTIISCRPLLIASDLSGVDIIHYEISIEQIDISAQTIIGATSILFTVDKPLNTWELMLKGLTVDSIQFEGKPLSFTHSNEIIILSFSNTLQVDSSYKIRIHYNGKPVKDPSWGGFYFSNSDGGYAYNMGVGFADSPHNYGRIWFPCKDNFTDKATYSFYIKTQGSKKAVCSGDFVGSILNPDSSITWHWELQQEVPTYLVSVAVADYEFVSWKYQGINTSYDVLLAAVASDTLKLKNSFTHLEKCIDIFERKYLPYQFDRVGFVVVPFNSGAMEHVCNIAYPKYAVDGSTGRESLMAHEFSHHWWGNLVTCTTAEDMWINEGWASYSENIFFEGVYGLVSYRDAVRVNHKNVLQYSHIRDEEPRPLYPLPHEFTYGSHAYDKGSDVAHTLRGYLGDSLFFTGINQFLNTMKFKNVSSIDLRDSLSKFSYYNLDDFFKNWVFEKGFPHFTVELKASDSKAEVEIVSALRFTDNAYNNVPLILTFMGNNQAVEQKKIVFSGDKQTYSFQLPFRAVFVAINMDEEISDAKTSYYQTIQNAGNYDFKEAMMEVNVSIINDSAFIYVEHHWVAPAYTYSQVQGIRLSDYRYWTVSGVFPDHFEASASIKYNGTEGSINGSNYLDHTMNIVNEDSLILMYRENHSANWIECEDYTVITGHPTNKIGDIQISDLKAGDYCLAVYDYIAGTGYQQVRPKDDIKLFPNPAKHELQVELADYTFWNIIRILNMKGQVLKEFSEINSNNIVLSLNDISPGIYILEVSGESQVKSKKIILEYK